MTYQVALSFEDGVTRFIKCDEDEVVADAAYRARINIPLDCRDGACGTCKAFCESGTYDGGFYIDEALTEDEAGQGYCLPCQMTPESDLVLQIAGTSESAKSGAATFESRIVAIDRFSATTAGFTIDVRNRGDLTFLPGQYVNVEVPGAQVTRSYSFSNGPDGPHLSFLVRLLDSGAMSDYLRDRAQVGDTVTFTGPRGSFFLREVHRPVLLLAGGTGLAPILSILESMRAKDIQQPVRLLYGVSNDDDLVELDRLDALTETLADFAYDWCVASAESSAPKKGYVTNFCTDEHLRGGDVDIYLCGPPPMVEGVRAHLHEIGVTPANFYFEKFATSGTESPTLTQLAS